MSSNSTAPTTEPITMPAMAPPLNPLPPLLVLPFDMAPVENVTGVEDEDEGEGEGERADDVTAVIAAEAVEELLAGAVLAAVLVDPADGDEPFTLSTV